MVTVSMIAFLAILAFPATHFAQKLAARTAALSNMRQLGMAMIEYSNDNQGLLPGRVVGSGSNKWPLLLYSYLGNPGIYVAPGDTNAARLSRSQLLSNGRNNSSYIFNGFNDMGAYANPSFQVRLNTLFASVNLILLAQKNPSHGDFYMDFEGNQVDVLITNSFGNGADYVFADGSARFLATNQYNDMMWCINKSYSIPAPPKGR